MAKMANGEGQMTNTAKTDEDLSYIEKIIIFLSGKLKTNQPQLLYSYIFKI